MNNFINIIIHIIILSIFLVIFFFLIISKINKNTIKSSLDNTINSQVDNILKNIDISINKSNICINRNKLEQLTNEMETKSKQTVPLIEQNNKNLLFNSIKIIIILFTILVLLIAYLKFYKKEDINLFNILKSNIVLFFFVGLVEVLFFFFITSKYIYNPPDYVAVSIVEKINYYINEIL